MTDGLLIAGPEPMLPRLSRPHTLLWAVGLAAAFCAAGCGKGDSGGSAGGADAAPAVNSSKPRTSRKSSQRIKPPRVKVGVKPAGSGDDEASSKTESQEFVDPRNVFEPFLAEGFEIVGTSPGPAKDDLFVVTPPPVGIDSTHFVIVERPQEESVVPEESPFRLPEGLTPLPEYGIHPATGLPRRVLCEKDDAEMALVPPGAAIVGSDEGPPETRPPLRVYLEPFYIDVTEVTLERYERFRDSRRERGRRPPREPLNAGSRPDRPALGLSWTEAVAYAHWAGKQLPNEAEWEKAARGTDGFRYPWGNERPIWPRPRTPQTIAAAGDYRTDRSPYGVFDMAGNAREWCEDRYSPTTYQELAEREGDLVRNWTGPRRNLVSDARTVRGNGADWAVWHRMGVKATERRPDIGFRCVIRLQPQED